MNWNRGRRDGGGWEEGGRGDGNKKEKEGHILGGGGSRLLGSGRGGIRAGGRGGL